MKLTPFQISLDVSLLIHAMIFAAIGLNALRPHPPTLERKDSVITLTLIAAPDEPAAKPDIPKIETVVTAPVEPPPPKPIVSAEVKPAEIPIPAETTPIPQPSVEVSKTTPPPQTQTKVRGDGSSPEPGLDTTTQKAEIGVRAEPNYRKNPEPPYPLAARRRREQGLVMLTAKVTAQGRATKVEIKQSSGHPLLDEAALNAVRDWEFQPARVGATAMESEIEVPVRFKLTE